MRLAALLVAAALFGAAGCDEVKKGGEAAGSAPAQVGMVTVAPQPVLFTTELAGRTSAFQIAEVRPQVSGIIQKRLFEEGTDVKAGDTLYQIDPATYRARYDSARAALAKAEANILPVRLKMERFRGLVGISAVSKQEFEDARAAYQQAVAEVAVNKAEVETARIRLNYTKVTSPISGRIGKSSVTPGALVTENQAASLSTVQQLDPIYVDVTQSSTEVLRLKRLLQSGQLQKAGENHAAVRLFLEDGSPYPHEGTLQFTDVSVDQSTGMITLRAIFPNPQLDLLPGMYVRAQLNEGLDEEAILVPQKAVMRDAKGQATAYVVTEQNTVELRNLKTGRTHDASWVVTEGLKPGDRLVVDGLQRIRPGMPVAAVEVQDEAPNPAGQ